MGWGGGWGGESYIRAMEPKKRFLCKKKTFLKKTRLKKKMAEPTPVSDGLEEDCHTSAK